MVTLKRLPLRGYGVAVLVCALTLLVKLLIDALIGRDTQFLLFFSAVLISALYGGFRPGLLATALCVFAGVFFFLPPRNSFAISWDGVVRSTIFVTEGILVSWLAAAVTRTNTTLRETRDRFQRLVDAGIVGVVMGAGDGVILEANDAFLKVVGYTRNELIGGRVRYRDLSPPDHLPALERSLTQLRTTGSFPPYEREYLHGDGHRVPALVGAARLPGTENNWIALVLDLTERRRADEAQRFLSEATAVLAGSLEYEATLAQVAALVVPSLADWCSVDIVEEGGAIRSLAVAHVDPVKVELARELQRRFPPDPNAPAGVARVLRTGEAELYEEISDDLLAAGISDREQLAVARELGLRSAMIVPLIARGRTLGAISFVSAESGRRYGSADLELARHLARRAALAVDNARLFRAANDALASRDEALAEAESERNRLRQVLEVMPEGVVIVDRRGRVVERNPAAFSIRGAAGFQNAPADIVVTQAWHAEKPDGTPFAPQELPITRAIRDGEVVLGEQMYLRYGQAEALTPLLLSCAPLRDADGAIVGAVAVFQDITPIKEFERQRDEFLGAVSHDLKNPLTSIKGLAQVLERRAGHLPEADGDRFREALQMIDATATRATALLNELLDVTRLQMQRPLELDRRPVDLAAIARRVAAEHQQASERHTVRVESEADLPPGEWDEARLERVLGNLLSNAIKYSPSGGEVHVRIAREGDELVLQVRDQGMGIPPDELPRVFERFFRASNVAGRISGTGIGLAAVRQIVELHGGSVAADSRPGAGTTFTVRLPLAPAPMPQ